MKKKFEISKKRSIITIGMLVLMIPVILFFSWLNFSSGEFDESVEAKLFSLADFKNGAMLSASCEAGIKNCEWSDCSDEDGDCVKVCQGKEELIAKYGELLINSSCRDGFFNFADHPSDKGTGEIDGDHYASCDSSECSAVSTCTMDWADVSDQTITDGGTVSAFSTGSGCPCLAPLIRTCDGNTGQMSGDSSYNYSVCSSTCPADVVACDPAQICIGQTCSDGTPGEKQCGWQEVAP